MRRRSDGAVFGWRALGRTGQFQLDPVSAPVKEIANFELPWSGSGGGLGRGDLVGGEAYEIQIVTDGVVIDGATTLPTTPVIVFDAGSTDLIEWSSPSGALGFDLVVDTDAPSRVLTTDTSYLLKRNVPSTQIPTGPRFYLSALDVNAWNFQSDSTLTSGGLRGAIGLFGAVSRASVRIVLVQ
jgi:hypothetical protein